MNRIYKTISIIFSVVVLSVFSINTIFAAVAPFSAKDFCKKDDTNCVKEDESGRTGSISCPANQIISNLYVHAGDGQTVYQLPNVGFSSILSDGGRTVTVNATTHQNDLSWIGVTCVAQPILSPTPTNIPTPTLNPTLTPTLTPTPTLVVTPTGVSSRKVTICHATGSAHNPYVRTVVDFHATAGHFDNNGTPESGHEHDILLQGHVDCPTPTPSHHPTPTPIHHVTPTHTPSHHPTPTPIHHVTPTPIHHVTPTPIHHVTPTPIHHVTPTPIHHLTPTIAQTATPTPTTVPGRGGTGGGDVLSDGRSSCPECTQAPKSTSTSGGTGGAVLSAQSGDPLKGVLGLSTTSSGTQANPYMLYAQLIGGLFFSLEAYRRLAKTA